MGVQIENIAPGDSKTFPKAGDTIDMHYVGTLQSNGSKFDSSRDRGQPFRTRIGVGQLIRGWDEGVPQLSLGQKARLICTPDYAYGPRGFPPSTFSTNQSSPPTPLLSLRLSSLPLMARSRLLSPRICNTARICFWRRRPYRLGCPTPRLVPRLVSVPWTYVSAFKTSIAIPGPLGRLRKSNAFEVEPFTVTFVVVTSNHVSVAYIVAEAITLVFHIVAATLHATAPTHINRSITFRTTTVAPARHILRVTAVIAAIVPSSSRVAALVRWLRARRAFSTGGHRCFALLIPRIFAPRHRWVHILVGVYWIETLDRLDRHHCGRNFLWMCRCTQLVQSAKACASLMDQWRQHWQ